MAAAYSYISAALQHFLTLAATNYSYSVLVQN